MNEKKLIQEYNQKDSLLAVTNYPPKGGVYNGNLGGVASFAKNTLLPLSKNQKIVVICEVLDRPESYEEDNILVIRVFKRNHFSLYKDFIKSIRKFDKIKNLLIEFEFAAYGDFVIASAFPLFLLILKLLGKRVTLVVHQVIFDLESLSGHLGIGKKSLKLRLFSFLLKFYYQGLGVGCHQIIVLEEKFKKRLGKIVNLEKITAISHGVDMNAEGLPKSVARKKLGIKPNDLVLLYFGYLTWYKGADFLVDVFVKEKVKVNGKAVRLIMAGGESATQNKKPHYRAFIKNLYDQAKKAEKLKITGFVPEEDISAYFAASDLVILPYRTFMSSSGPLSLSISYQKPFIISSPLKDYFDSPEFAVALKEAGLEKGEVVFPLQASRFVKKAGLALGKKNLAKLTNFSRNLGQKRDFNVLASNYAQVVGAEEQLIVIPRIVLEPSLAK